MLFLLACILLWVRSTNSPLLRAILQEDGPFENIQAVLFFLSGLGFVLIYIKNSRNLWYLALSMLLIALAGEEISWGQRIFSIASPAWELKDNVQGEMNLHNINGIHQHIRLTGILFCIFYFVVIFGFLYKLHSTIFVGIWHWYFSISDYKSKVLCSG